MILELPPPRRTVVYPVIFIHGDHPFHAQLVLPGDLQQEEADRLCAMIQTLVLPHEVKP